MVLEVLADARQVGHDGDAERPEQLGRPDAGQLEELRRVERPAGQDHLAGRDPVRRQDRPRHLDADGPPALEQHAVDERARPHLEVRAAHGGMQVRAGGRPAAAPPDVPVEGREPLLPVAVHVVRARVARLDRRREERAEQRVRGRTALERERPAVAAVRVVVVGRGAILHPLEVRQAVGVVPGRHPRIGRPALVVEGVAALEDHPVDAGRPAEHPAAGVVDPPPTHERLGLGLVHPVVEPAADRERQRRRHVDEHVPRVVGAASLEDEDAVRRVGAEPVREGAARRPPADDDEVVPGVGHRRRERGGWNRPAASRRPVERPPCVLSRRGSTSSRRPGGRRPTSWPRPRASCPGSRSSRTRCSGRRSSS